MSFSKLNKSIWSIYYGKLNQSIKLDQFKKQSNEFLLKNCYTIVNINGINFEEFSNKHQFIKPNDLKNKHLMDHCARTLIKQFEPHIFLSYGFSDQFSFVIDSSTNFCNRNLIDILSMIVSNFTSNYVFNWSRYFDGQLQYAPTFKGNYLLIPTEEYLIKYLKTKEHECYILNLNRTLYAALIGEYRNYILDLEDNEYKLNEDNLKGNKQSSTKIVKNEKALNLIKNEIDSIAKINEHLFKHYDINYNNELELFKKGTLMFFDTSNQIKSSNSKVTDQILRSILYIKLLNPIKNRLGECLNKVDGLFSLSQNKSLKKFKSSEPVELTN